MKILHVIPGIEQISGGPSAAAVNMCTALYKNGIDISLITTRDPLNRYNLVSFDAIQNKVIFCSRWKMEQYAFSWDIKKWFASNIKQFDLLHIHSLFSYPSHISAVCARKTMVPYIICPHGSLDPWHIKKKYILKLLYVFGLQRSIIRDAYAIHATSKREAGYLLRLFHGSNIRTIPLGVDIPAIKEPHTRDVGESLRILFLSRLHPKKGIPVLIAGVKELVRRGISITLRLIGGPDPYDKGYVSKLHQLVVERGLSKTITFGGFLYGEKKADEFINAHVFVLPSKDENFGIVVTEAMSYGLPVVVSDQVALAEDIRVANAGIVINSEDSFGLADAVEMLSRNEEMRIDMAKQARKLALKYSWESMSCDLISLYKEALQRSSL